MTKQRKNITKENAAIMLIFSGLKKKSVRHFLTSDEIMLSQVDMLGKILKEPDDSTFAFLKTIEHAGLISNYVAHPEELALFYEGCVDAMKTIVLVREVYGNLQKKSINHSGGIIACISILKHKIAKQEADEVFISVINTLFKASTNLQSFTTKLQDKYLHKNQGFNKFARKEAVERLLSELNNQSPRRLAIRLMGTAVQLRWPKAELDSGKLEIFITQIEENLEDLKSDNQRISGSIEDLTSIFDEIFSMTFFVEKEKKR